MYLDHSERLADASGMPEGIFLKMTLQVNDPTDLVEALSRELAGVLEMVFEPHEMQRLFPGALGGLKLAKQYFLDHGLPVPAVVEHVLAKT